MASSMHHHEALRILHYVFPSITLAYFMIARIYSFCAAQTFRKRHPPIIRKLLALLQAAVLSLFAFEALLLVINDLISYPNGFSKDDHFHIVFEVLIWILLLAALLESSNDLAWYPFCGSWIICVTSEVILFGFELPTVTPFRHQAADPFIYLRICLQVIRLALVALLPLIHFHRYPLPLQEKDEESTSLLHRSDDAPTKALDRLLDYGSVRSNSQEHPENTNDDSGQPKTDEMKQAHHSSLHGSGNWIQYIKGFSLFVPLLWPTKQLRAQLSVLAVIICLFVGRSLNLLLPRQFGVLIDSLSPRSIDYVEFPGMQLVLFLLYRLLTSYKIMVEVESSLWFPFGTFAVRNIKSAAHCKVMFLSRDFHTSKPVEEMTRIIDHGTTVTWLLRNFFIFLMPCVLDILIFGIYLSCVFGIYMALLLSITIVLYVWFAKRSASKRSTPQTTVLETGKKEDQILYQSISEWDTVTYSNAQIYENERLSKVTEQRLRAESALQWLVAQANLCSETVLHLGFAGACALVIFQVVHGRQSVGSFAMLIFYIVNVSSDIHSVAVLASSLLEDLAEVEILRDLFLAEPSIRDGLTVFRPYEGAVLLSGVNFAYDDNKPILQDFNFSAEAGQKIAIVGETGAGKTTLLRLLMRFHDVQSGKIMIDGQDVRDVTLRSLRNAIGVIPLNLTLFNNTILENVRYAKLEASDQEVFEACKEAGVHERILSYAAGYSTQVGESGIELTEEEKQQIAIAQVALKNPKMVLLDEASGSDDAEAEDLIQKALHRLTKGRTTFAIAQRLSTIQDSDIVLVMKEGSIVEQGSPFELLEANGEFAKIWKDQFIPGSTDNVDTTSAIVTPSNQRSTPAIKRHMKDRSGSSFRADAPEFVPHFQQGTESSNGQTNHPHLGPGHRHDSHDTPTHAHSHRAGPDSSSQTQTKRMQYKTNKKNMNANGKSGTSTETTAADSREVTSSSQLDGSAGPSLIDGKTVPRLSRWQRRRQAKSDPNSSIVSYEEVKSGAANQQADKKEASALSRRVSGPGRYPSEPSNARIVGVNTKATQKGHIQQNRRKRNQQSHLKKSERSNSDSISHTAKVSFAPPLEGVMGHECDTSPSIPNDKENTVITKDYDHSPGASGLPASSKAVFAPES